MLFVAGMWFQDLFNYDFRRTEMCIIPYGTQEGEISFCAYNTGVGWRQVVEKMHATATVAEWHRTRGRHPVYAKNQSAPPALARTVRLPLRQRAPHPAVERSGDQEDCSYGWEVLRIVRIARRP